MNAADIPLTSRGFALAACAIALCLGSVFAADILASLGSGAAATHLEQTKAGNP